MRAFTAGVDIDQLPPAVWAYVGDAVFELAMRVMTLAEGPRRMQQMHRQTARYVAATFQAGAAHRLEPHLSPDEADIMRRGRNAKSGHVPRSASVSEYRMSTGLEGLLGYLYLKGRHERLDELLVILRAMGGGNA